MLETSSFKLLSEYFLPVQKRKFEQAKYLRNLIRKDPSIKELIITQGIYQIEQCRTWEQISTVMGLLFDVFQEIKGGEELCRRKDLKEILAIKLKKTGIPKKLSTLEYSLAIVGLSIRKTRKEIKDEDDIIRELLR